MKRAPMASQLFCFLCFSLCLCIAQAATLDFTANYSTSTGYPAPWYAATVQGHAAFGTSFANPGTLTLGYTRADGVFVGTDTGTMTIFANDNYVDAIGTHDRIVIGLSPVPTLYSINPSLGYVGSYSMVMYFNSTTMTGTTYADILAVLTSQTILNSMITNYGNYTAPMGYVNHFVTNFVTVPEPGTCAILLAGFGILGFTRRRSATHLDGGLMRRTME